ncbi:winged helix-turn-helix domain-containing protein [Salinibacterium sp. M195]|uniref:ArsR/SmtB family transcription factor n=1 Tax=Salinibacterium sp. M195 TaxID=2583374 RepID=UPI0021050703|nr:winged helix-turn-helix domain-containing protein [Salinibacterium sp. M195]QYH35782.1 winged helix-turn-helix transcriptional regulator [Salinibacterium sp. M195]
MNSHELGAWLAAVANPQRMRILAELSGGQKHVSDLARRVGMSRALLYMHLAKLEESGFVAGHHELSDDGKALKFFEVVPFRVTVTPALLARAVHQSAQEADDADGPESASNRTSPKGK